ncbi:MAG: hypothetical protein ACJ8FY_19385 [Gemmataceae bacterium]
MRLFVNETEGKFSIYQTFEREDGKSGPLVRLWKGFTSSDIYYAIPDDAGISRMKSSWLLPQAEFNSMDAHLSDDCSEIRRLSTWPIDRCFVYVDVSDFSQQRPGQQALIIGSLISMIQNWKYWNYLHALSSWKDLEAMLCIGDGYIFVLKDVLAATYFAAHLAQLIEARVAQRCVPVEFHFRMGVHVGPVYCFWDWGRGDRSCKESTTMENGTLKRTELGGWNYIGEGINGGQRVLAAAGKDADDIVFISSKVKQELTALDKGQSPCRQILQCLMNRGRRLDKHNKPWRVYELNHTALCESNLPAEAIL